MCQLDWAKGCPIAGKTLFLGMSVRLGEGGLQKRLTFEWVHRTKKIILINVHGHHLTHVRAEWNKNAEGGWICSLLELKHLPSPAFGLWCFWFSEGCSLGTRTYTTSTPSTPRRSQALKPTPNYTLAFLGFQLTEGRLWGFLASITTKANLSHKSLLWVYTFLFVLFLWRSLIIQKTSCSCNGILILTTQR